ncbi:MAG: hypothetical protein CFE26_08815 [Verrucomicrobiales bacterium VVV1]|nr:MAG: hypothetical protein CFE26_08815 [Verrucomicrobiales bacterium VVV1]
MGAMSLDNVARITPETFESMRRVQVLVDDVLLNITGASIGRACRVGIDIGDAVVNQHVAIIRTRKEKLSSAFLAYAIRTERLQNAIFSGQTGAAQGGFNHQKIRALEIPLPPLPEQHRIVEILDQADSLRQQRRQANELSQRILPALFQEMFGDPATMSIRYPVGTFEDFLVSTKNGLYKHADFYGEGIPILKMFNIFQGSLRMDRVDRVSLDPTEHSAYRLSVGDILFNRVNTPELVGKCAVIDKKADGAVFESKNIRVKLDLTKVSPYFASFFYNTEYGHKELTRRLKHAAGMATITGPQVREAPFPHVPLDLQRQFEAHCQTLIEFRAATATSSATLETLFQTLLHRAFDGSLTAKWREGHAKELLEEMEHQAR